jgi:hypothetical protein
MIETAISGDQLRIGAKGSFESKTELVARVTAFALTGASVEGANDISIKGVSGEALTIDVSGASKLAASGKVQKLEIDVSGTAQIDATALHADDVVRHASGSAKIEVDATSSLDVTVDGRPT